MCNDAFPLAALDGSDAVKLRCCVYGCNCCFCSRLSLHDTRRLAGMYASSRTKIGQKRCPSAPQEWKFNVARRTPTTSH